MAKNSNSITSFNFKPGQLLCQRYCILEKLGAGVEGEVYKIAEIDTHIERAAKLFFPQCNPNNKVAVRYAKLLHKLSVCPIVVHYHQHDTFYYQKHKISCLISEYVEGEILSEFLKRQPGGYIGIFRGLQLLHALTMGLEAMHRYKISHGDLHLDNIIVKRYGLGFDLKVLDMYHWRGEYRKTLVDDICDSIYIFYQAIGGRKRYAKHPSEIKKIILGLKRGLIVKKFRSAMILRDYLEKIEWQSAYRE